MLKRLKLKFILSNMAALSIVVLAIFTALCVLIYMTEEQKITRVLESNIEMVEHGFEDIPEGSHQPEGYVYNHSFSVFVSDEGAILYQTENSLDERSLKVAVNDAMSSEYLRGSSKSSNLSYLKAESFRGTIISFVSREHLENRVSESIGQSTLAALVSLLIFLYISKKIADMAIAPVEEAWKQQKQFLADASHDLKTPLTVILANTNIVASHKDESVESQMKWIESTAEEAGRMSDLVNKMLELAKNESTKEELRFGEVDLSETVENAILQFEVVAFEKNITIESGIEPGIIIKSHKNTVAKVLEILFDNAIKYSPENETIAVSLYHTAKKVYFSINNKGECISEEDIPHIFERFYRTNKEREVGGHGLGLSLAKKKCDMLGAKIAVESNPHDGTTFTVIFKGKK